MSNKKHRVVVQVWGLHKPDFTNPEVDGFSLHLTDVDRQLYFQDYWNQMPESRKLFCSLQLGSSYEYEVDAQIFAKVTDSKNGIRCYGNPPGWSGEWEGLKDWITKRRDGHI